MIGDYNGNKLTTKFRDKMFIERGNILNNYADKTMEKGDMYYIYGRNSKMDEGYNICACEKEKSHIIIEISSNDLPTEAKIGSVLRKFGNNYVIDKEDTNKIADEINTLMEKILEEQTEFLQSKRIEGHIYEISENDGDRVWLFDITSNSNEGVEEIDFPKELLQDSKEGDLFIYENGEYQKWKE